jgi:hypothetical protein
MFPRAVFWPKVARFFAIPRRDGFPLFAAAGFTYNECSLM